MNWQVDCKLCTDSSHTTTCHFTNLQQQTINGHQYSQQCFSCFVALRWGISKHNFEFLQVRCSFCHQINNIKGLWILKAPVAIKNVGKLKGRLSWWLLGTLLYRDRHQHISVHAACTIHAIRNRATFGLLYMWYHIGLHWVKMSVFWATFGYIGLKCQFLGPNFFGGRYPKNLL